MDDEVFFYPNRIDLDTSNLQTPPSSPKSNTTSPPLKIVLKNSRGDFFCHRPGRSVNLVLLPLFSYFGRKRTRATKILERDLRQTKMGLFWTISAYGFIPFSMNLRKKLHPSADFWKDLMFIITLI